MRLVGKLGVALLVFSLFASPLMACMLPDSALTDEERECCHQMAGDCGQMPSLHSCCKTTVRESDPYVSSSRIAISAHSHETLAILPTNKNIGLPDDISQFVAASDAHAPPESLLLKISVLRI